MSKFTPGPCAQHEVMQDCVTFHGKHGIENLFLQNLDGYYACQSDDDARLISAAPDLLEALTPFVVANSSEELVTIVVRSADITKARAAIQKAIGETP